MRSNVKPSRQLPVSSSGLARNQVSAKARKAHGIHYTPPMLAAYLAKAMVGPLISHVSEPQQLVVLDPACGDGELLNAVFYALPLRWRKRLVLVGRDKDVGALAQAKMALEQLPVASVDLRVGDFLELAPIDAVGGQSELKLFDPENTLNAAMRSRFDAVISNPPYVRTQVLGSSVAQNLAARFQLTGRVDLYHAFIKAMTGVLRPGGVLGLLTSNRFLTVQSGSAIRDWLTTHFKLLRVVDLGDTKLFEAAVLPAIVIAERRNGSTVQQQCEFMRIYESKDCIASTESVSSVFDRLDGSFAGSLCANGTSFKVETGHLQTSGDSRRPWSMTNQTVDTWLSTVKSHSSVAFGEVAKICVGIKTTADPVFVRDDWESLPKEERPEAELLYPIITHHVAARWHLPNGLGSGKRVLYPYVASAEQRQPIDLEEFPRAYRYLLNLRDQLQRRTYVTASGREWFEIWVPHRPKDWTERKVAFPDISESSKFFLVEPGWIVNGDCYWTKLLPGKDESWLLLMLAVANSSFCLKFYDTVFHNKLYAGRRRFMSQYVSRFPLPKISRCGDILDLTPQILRAAEGQQSNLHALESQLNQLVWKAFGLSEEVGG